MDPAGPSCGRRRQTPSHRTRRPIALAALNASNPAQICRRDDECFRRAAERLPQEQQEAGYLAFRGMLGVMERASPELRRLRWEVTIDLGDAQVRGWAQTSGKHQLIE